MSLRFSKLRTLFVVVLAALVAGCASGPKRPASEGGQADRVGNEAVGVSQPDINVPGDAQVSFDRALTAMREGNVTEAELELEQLILEHPDFAGPRVNLAIIYMDSGRNEDAQAALERALALNPTHAEAYNQFGILMRRQGKFAEAERSYGDALAIAPDYPLAHYNLGVLLDLYMKRPDEALPHYERYQTLVGEDERVKKWIIDLRRRLGITEPTTRIAQETQEEAP